MRFLNVLAAAFLAVVLTGCAAQKISQEDRAALRRVSIATVQMPEKATVFGANAGAGFLFGGPLGLMLSQSGSDLPTAYAALLKQHKIDIAAYLKEEVRAQLAVKGIQVVDDEKQADTTMTIQVFQYGLTGDILAGDTRFPQMAAEFKLIKASQPIWKTQAAAHVSKEVMGKVEARPIPDYFSDAKFLDSQIRKVHKIVVTEALGTL